MLLKSIVLFAVVLGTSDVIAVGKQWWTTTFIYQIYPRSFKDSNGDGVGDLNGITSKLQHLVSLNVSALWLSPVYKSPMVDFGYDISNFTDIDPVFGNLMDFTNLTSTAKALGLKVLMDFVPNHSSDQHPWFKMSIQRTKPYDEYYIWQNATIVNGTRRPPNNWLSKFGGSAWEWNSQRGQYYFHQFAVAQPDLNYRSTALDLEMKKVLTFWLDRGVDGFRIDAINFMFEDPRLLDEPVVNGTGLPADDWGTLNHIYTMDQNDSYLVLQSWRQLVDNYTKKADGDAIILLTEGFTTLPYVMKYYEYGSDVPFNFMFMSDLNNKSRAIDFRNSIEGWLKAMPEGYSANWVVGNHDNSRAASRFGIQRADQLSMLAAVLPGVGIIYNGDEIGMEDLWLSYAETVDPAGCNAGPDRYHLKSRDPARTPFQWDDTISAGFSTNNKTWLPVNPNYKTLNLEAQKQTSLSHYSIFKKLVVLKNHPFMNDSKTNVTLVTSNILAVVRVSPTNETVTLLVNYSKFSIVANAHSYIDHMARKQVIYAASWGSQLLSGQTIIPSYFRMPAAASMILAPENIATELFDELRSKT